MAVSGTVNFALDTDQIIEKAFHRLGKASEGEAVSARMYSDGLSSLNLIIKSKLGTSDRLFLRTQTQVILTANTASYALSPMPLRVLSVRRRDSSGRDVPLNVLSEQEYFDTPNKADAPSVPVSYFFDPQTTSGTLYVWPAPSADAASEYTLQLTTIRRIDDMVSSSDSLDMPQEWLDPVIWMLADDLETEYPVNDPRLAMKIGAKAAEAKALLDWWDTENTSVFIQPDLE